MLLKFTPKVDYLDLSVKEGKNRLRKIKMQTSDTPPSHSLQVFPEMKRRSVTPIFSSTEKRRAMSASPDDRSEASTKTAVSSVSQLPDDSSSISGESVKTEPTDDSPSRPFLVLPLPESSSLSDDSVKTERVDDSPGPPVESPRPSVDSRVPPMDPNSFSTPCPSVSLSQGVKVIQIGKDSKFVFRILNSVKFDENFHSEFYQR